MRGVGPQLRVCGAVALTVHSPVLDWVSIDQTTPVPEPAGSGSLTVTPVAVPVPLFLTVTVKPIGAPALTEAASAVLVARMSASLTVKHSVVPFVPSPAVYRSFVPGV